MKVVMELLMVVSGKSTPAWSHRAGAGLWTDPDQFVAFEQLSKYLVYQW